VQPLHERGVSQSGEDIVVAIQQDMGNVLLPPPRAEAFIGAADQQMRQVVAAES
jgi:hypothetical protein